MDTPEYRINGEDTKATDDQEMAWQDLRDAVSNLAEAFGVDHSVLSNVLEATACIVIGDSYTAAEARVGQTGAA